MKNVSESFVVPEGFGPDPNVIKKLREIFKIFKTSEEKNGLKLLLLCDDRSNAFYLNCHLDSKVLALKTDLDAVLDPTESEDYKLNREIYTDTYAYRLMESDALKGRSFEDLIVEYDTSYRAERPLKVFGGQHRIMAITAAVKKDVSVVHGVRVYFGLSIEQKVNIAMANNTSIAVSNDLLDRMQENLLGANLRNWCQTVGLLDEGQNFVDRRSPEGIPTVRIARTLLVNFYLGKDAKEDDFHVPIVCSSGPGIDEQYKNLRDNIDWSDKALQTMGRQFARIHKLQRERVLGRDTDKYIEFANKTMHPCIAASWAYTSGFLQRDPEALNNHYALADVDSPGDPLNAKALLNARLRGVDPDTYRGLGARINNVELGRMLEAFINYIGDTLAQGETFQSYEIAYLTDKKFDVSGGTFQILEQIEYHRLEDKLKFLICKFVPDFDFVSTACWSRLIDFKKFRDNITHPRQDEDEIEITEYKKKMETSLSSAIEIMNYLCKGIFKRPLRKKLLDLRL